MTPFLFLSSFETFLRTEKRYSQHTIEAYLKDVKSFLIHSSVQNEKELADISHHLIRSWIVEMISSGLTGRTVNRKLSSLRTFLKLAEKKGLIVNNPMRKIVAPKMEKRLPQFAKETELDEQALSLQFSDDFFGLRDKLMFELFYQTGIRLSELVQLNESDVKGLTIKVLGKRNKERIVPISKELNSVISHYLKLKGEMGFSDEFLVVTDKGDKLYPKFVYRKINSYLGRVTKLEQCSPHVLRHTFATHMLNNGAGLEALKDLLGHANLSATQVYTHNSFAQLTHIYSQAHPRGHKKN